MSECSHDCSSCSANCGSRTQEKTDFLEPLYRESKVKKVIGIVSGKGGVGKSMTTSLLGVAAMRKGLHTAILDADVTGPSIPQASNDKFRNRSCILKLNVRRRNTASDLERSGCSRRCKTVLG